MKAAIKVDVARLPHALGLPLPSYATDGAAGMDLIAALDIGEVAVIEPGARDLIPTGLRIALPAGYEMQIRPRSGLALREGITILNSPGTIDDDYRKEVGVIVMNAGKEPFTIKRGMRIAQAVFAPVTRAEWREVDNLPATRREGGFGSTGDYASDGG